MTKPSFRKWTKDEDARLIALRAQGYNWRSIGIELDRSEQGCERRVRDLKRGPTPVRVSSPPSPDQSTLPRPPFRVATVPYVRCLDDGSVPEYYQMAEPVS